MSFYYSKHNKMYNGLPYVIAVIFIFWMTSPILNGAVASGITSCFELLFFVALAFYAIVYFKIDEMLRIQLCPLVIMLWTIWSLAIIKFFLSERLHTGILFFAMLGLASTTLVIIRYLQSALKDMTRIKSYLISNWSLWLLILICIALSIPTISDISFFDSFQYYNEVALKIGLNSFNFAFNDIFNYLLSGHTTSGFSLIILLGELINDSFGMRIANILLYSISIYCCYCIFGRYVDENDWIVRILGTCVYAFSPWTLGLIGYTTIDNPSLYFVVILFYAYIFKKDILLIMTGWFFCNTKEPNAIYYAVFVFSIWIIRVYLTLKNEKMDSTVSYLRIIKDGILFITPLISWLILFKGMSIAYGSWMTQNVVTEVEPITASVDNISKAEATVLNGIPINSDLEEYVHVFGFTWANFVLKIKEIFVYNFSWLLVLISAGSFAIFLIRGKKKSIQKKDIFVSIIPILALLCTVFIFNIIYLDWDNPRYIMICAAPLTYICFVLTNQFLRRREQVAILLILSICMLLQSFTYADPITRMASASFNPKDSSYYNRNYHSIQKCVEKILSDLEVSNDRIVVYLDDDIKMYGPPFYYNQVTKKLNYAGGDYNTEFYYPNEADFDIYLCVGERKQMVPTDAIYLGRYKYVDLVIDCFVASRLIK